VSASRVRSDAVFDVAIVGAGILGLAVAYELKRREPGISLVLLERESDVAQHQTGHNSGVIHSGVYYAPGSMKARLCVEGSRLMYEFCDQHDVRYERCGKLIVALTEDELPRLDELERRGRANQVPGLKRLNAQEIREVEPGCLGISALHCPETGIVDYYEVARALANDLRASGADLRFGHHVRSLQRDGSITEVISDGETVRARYVVACAGLWSDRLAVSAGAPQDPRIVPFRGAYLSLAPTATPIVHSLIYPVPNPELPFLGVHVTKLVGGELVLGPTAMLVLARDGYKVSKVRARDVWDTVRWPGTWKMARKFWKVGVGELLMAAQRQRFLRAAAQYVPAVMDVGLLPGERSGVRAQALAHSGDLVDDFALSETPGALHVRNAPSPAATSSLALARAIVDRIEVSSDWITR
jgi:L-2-hydroxyglutarate oxidase LhgO